jgi:hypothetical protein
VKTYRRAVARIASRISDAANRTVENLRRKEVEHEPAFTDRMLARIEDAVNGQEIDGLKWSAKTLTDRGFGSQEKQFGADFAGVLEVNLPDYRVSKGFLAQAKLIRGSSIGDKRELVSQCERMLDLILICSSSCTGAMRFASFQQSLSLQREVMRSTSIRDPCRPSLRLTWNVSSGTVLSVQLHPAH